MTTYLFIDIEAAGPEGSTENDRPDSATWVPLQLGVTEQSGHSKFWDVAASSPVTLTEFHEKHKITATGVSWEEAVQELVSLMDGIDGPVALVAHNGWGFDFPLLERLAPQVLAGRILIDSLGLTRYWRPWSKNTLDQLVMDFCVPVKQMMPEDSSSHNAEVDACLLSLVWEAFTSGRWVSEWFSGQTPETLSSLSHQVHTSREAYYSWKFVIPGADCFRRNRDGYMASFLHVVYVILKWCKFFSCQLHAILSKHYHTSIVHF